MTADSSRAVSQAYADLLSLAVHELRTPASVVAGYLRMLQRNVEPALTPQQDKLVREAERSSIRLAELIAELGEISKLDAGRTVVQEEAFDLFQLVSQVAAGVHEAQDRGVRLEVRGDATAAPMRGDPGRLRNALMACFRAVLREQPEACTVAVDRRMTAQPDTTAVIVVAETTAVEPAYDAPPARLNEKRGGLGLQLPIARRVVEQHGGRIWSPEPPGSPTAILLSFPLNGRPSLSGSESHP